jgi:transposase
MQGHHHYQPELFSQIDYEELIPKSHLLRKIDKVLDLSFLRNMTAPFYSSEYGRPSIDPEIFVRMILLEFLYNINSDRQLCQEIGYNLAYRWFCKFSLKDKVPDHSSITRIRDRLGEETYKNIFHKVVEQCKEAGLFKGERLMADGSMIAANASIYTMKERESDSDDEPKIKPGSGTGQRESKDGLSNNDLKKHSIAGKKLTNQTHYSPTDPDATLSGKHGEYKALRYKTHHMIDADSRVIVDCHVTIFPERLDVVEKDLSHPIQEVIADRGYGSGKNLLLLKEKGIESNIPLWSTKVGHSFNKEEGFAFSRTTMTAVCPEGHPMKKIKNDNESSMFVLSKRICEICPQYLSCCSDAQRRNGRGKRIRIHHNQDIYNEVLEKEKNPMFKIKLRERMWKMEGIFAEAKSFHGLRRARYRGRWKVQAQVYMISTVQNLKRLAATVIFILKSIWVTLMGPNFGWKNFEKSWFQA